MNPGCDDNCPVVQELVNKIAQLEEEIAILKSGKQEYCDIFPAPAEIK